MPVLQYIAEKIMNINEHGAFDPKSKNIEQDDEIFHRTRLVNCGYFMQIILGGMHFSFFLHR